MCVVCRDGSYSVMEEGGMSDDDDVAGARAKTGGSKLTTEAK